MQYPVERVQASVAGAPHAAGVQRHRSATPQRALAARPPVGQPQPQVHQQAAAPRAATPRVSAPRAGASPGMRQRSPSVGPGGVRRAPIVGDQVDYHSVSYRSWIPAFVTCVDPETGAVQLNVKPQPLSLQDQHHVMRPRTRPEKVHLEWMRAVMREGRIEDEARAIFARHATSELDADGQPAAVLRVEVPCLAHQALHAAAAEVDALLGVSGCIVHFHSEGQQLERRVFTLDDFVGTFWELLSNTQHEYGSALPCKNEGMYRREDPHTVYNFGETLGKGTYGLVKLAYDRRTKGKRAVKLVSKQRMSGSMDQLQSEIEHLCLLDHPHIVKLYEYYDDKENVYLVTDFCSGGELQQAILKRRQCGRRFPERFVADAMQQVLMATAHVHARGIVHLDIKSANIMLMPNKGTLMPVATNAADTLEQDYERPHVVLIDLGVAQLFNPGNFSHNKPMGTPATMAPEVWSGVFTPKADVFSCGVVLFELLSLRLPLSVPCDRFEGPRFWQAPPPIDWKLLQPASPGADELCRLMMLFDRVRRPTAAQCLRSPFLQDGLDGMDEAGSSKVACAGSGPAAPRVPEEIVRRLAKMPERSVLYKSIALSIARAWPANQLPTVKRAFQELSVAGHGRLDTAQVDGFLQSLGVKPSCAKKAAEAMDLNRDGIVDWTEFVAACTYLGSDEFETTLWEIFQEADSDDDQLLSQGDLSKLMPLEHEGEAVRDLFQGLTGRTEPGARVDWPTFRRHFKSVSLGDGEESADARRPWANVGPACLEQAFDFVDKVRRGLFAGDAVGSQHPAEPQEEDLKRLQEMGFSDRDQCMAVLQRHRNKLSNSAVEELCR